MYGLGNAENLRATLRNVAERGEKGLSDLKGFINKPGYEREHRTYRIPEMLVLTQLPRSTFRKYAVSGKIKLRPDDSPQVLMDKRDFTLEEIAIIRAQVNRSFWYPNDPPPKRKAITLAMAMFKGGVAKTTQSTNLAAKAAISGLKTLFVDCDYQASGTMAFGMIPGYDIDNDKNLYSALLEDPKNIIESIQKTHIHGLDLLPASLDLSAANIELIRPELNAYDRLGNPVFRLKNAIEVIQGDYDLIILDCPPNFEAVSMNALVASDAFVLPITPSMLALSSAVSFCSTVSELFDSILKYDNNQTIDNKLFRVLLTNDPQNQESERVVSVIKQLFGNYLMSHAMPRTIALDRAANDLSILYDMKRKEVRGDKKSFDRAINSMDLINDEILTALKSIWTSKEWTSQNQNPEQKPQQLTL